MPFAKYELAQAAHPSPMPQEQFTYDGAGNRLTMVGQSSPPSQTTVYTYDFEGRLIELDSPGLIAQYKYNPFGRRIEKNVNGVVSRYVYDGPNIAAEYDGNWNLVTKYLPSLDIDDPLAMEQAAGSYFYHKDGLGTVTDLTNTSGSAVKNYRYRNFGEIYSETGSLVQPFAFTGREYDPESGLYYYRARYYDPRAGRFLTKDSLGFDGGDTNLYRYVWNSPTNWIDPHGLFFIAPAFPILLPAFEAALAYTGSIIAGAIIGQSIWDLWFAKEKKDTDKEGKACPVTADPSKSPGEGWKWRGKGLPGSKEGNWVNPSTGEWKHNHPDSKKHAPHQDYQDPSGNRCRVYPDGRKEPKK
jgi:RHS repeat-associated protein